MENDTRTALYRLYDAEQNLLYIGITYDPLMRFEQHTRRSWWPLAESVKVEWFGSRPEATQAERDAIKAENPLHNIVHSNNPAWPQHKPPVNLQGMSADELQQHFAELDKQQRKARRLLEEAGELAPLRTPQEAFAELSEELIRDLVERLRQHATPQM